MSRMYWGAEMMRWDIIGVVSRRWGNSGVGGWGFERDRGIDFWSWKML